MKSKVFKNKKIVIASHNKGKIKEIRDLLEPLDIDIFSSADFDLQEPVEDGFSFEENALIKSSYVSKMTRIPSLSDDSGICFTDLNNEPGIYSARYNGASSSFESKMLKLLATLKNQHERDAFFVCVLAFVKNDLDPLPRFYEGFWYGQIANEIKGEHGFGYDPIFFDPEYQLCVGEMASDQKLKLSHRAKATRAFIDDWQI